MCLGLQLSKYCVKHTAIPFLDFRSQASLDFETLSSEEASSSESLISPAPSVICLVGLDTMLQLHQAAQQNVSLAGCDNCSTGLVQHHTAALAQASFAVNTKLVLH